MKKLIAIVLAILALSALTVSAFAAGTASAAPTAEAREEAPEITAKLTEADSLAAALKDAGMKETDVTVDRNKLSEKTTTGGETVAVYSVKFFNDTTTCKYYIDANTGAILYKSIEFQNPDFIFQSRGSGDDRGEASGEMRGEGSGEMTDGASGEMTDSASGDMSRSGRHHSASSEMDADAAADIVTA